MTSTQKRPQLRLITLVGAFFFILLFSLSLSIIPVNARENKKAVMIIIDKITLSDLANNNLPHLQRLMNEGALGLMNTNTGANRNALHSYLTIGAGNRAAAGNWAGLAFNREERYLSISASETFYSLTGQQTESSNIVHLGFQQMLKSCSNLKQTVVPGALGNILNKNNLKTAVIGNADLKLAGDSTDYRRFAVNIAMNKEGKVDLGDVSSNLLGYNKMFPFHLSTDFIKLAKVYREIIPQADFIVLETGDTSRIEEYQDYLAEDKSRIERNNSLERVDHFVGQILVTLNPQKDLLIVVSPNASKQELTKGNSLTPLLVWGKGIQPGFLTSGTTHRKGIVTNLDLAPTVINFLGGQVPSYMSGQQLESVHGNNVLLNLLAVNKQIVNTSNQHGIILKTFVTLQIIMLIIALLAILFSTGLPKFFLTILQNVILGLAFVPLVLLYLSLLAPSSLFLSFLSISVIAAILVLISKKIAQQEIDPLVFLGLSTSLSLIIDIFLGSPLMKTSLLGYDPMVGARFYGIGNEYSGVLLGSSILGSMAFMQRFSQYKKYVFWLISLFFLLIIFASASPKLGTDVGGTITSIIAFSIVYLKIKGKRANYRVFFTIVLSVIALLLLAVCWDIGSGGGGSTHIGRAASLVKQGGWEAAQQILQRKLATNLRLIRYTIWTRVLLTSLVALAVLFFRPIGVVRKIMQIYPYLANGFIGILVASIIGFSVNDSGVVQAATTIIYGVCPLIYLVLGERRKRK